MHQPSCQRRARHRSSKRSAKQQEEIVAKAFAPLARSEKGRHRQVPEQTPTDNRTTAPMAIVDIKVPSPERASNSEVRIAQWLVKSCDTVEKDR
jgi:hypothetical protein